MPAARPRNAEATKNAILEAARAAFASDSFERIGVRDIAAKAGVNAALVIRYFGSKEQLFTAAIAGAEQVNLQDLFEGPLNALGTRLAHYALAKDSDNAALLALLRSAPNAQASAMLRAALQTQFAQPLEALLTGTHRAERAGLIAAQIVGLAVTRAVIGHDALKHGDEAALEDWFSRSLQTLVDG
jgi:AcrR family transcriptional regulator